MSLKNKPLLIIVSDKTRDHFHTPLGLFKKLRIVHLHRSKFADSRLLAKGVKAVRYNGPFELFSLLKKYQPDYLQGLEPYYGYSRIKVPFKIIFLLAAVWLYVKLRRPLFFFHVLENIPPSKKYGRFLGWKMKLFGRIYASSADFIFYANRGALQNIKSWKVPAWKAVSSKWGFWGVDLALFAPARADGEPTVGFVGSLSKQKGIKDFIAIAKKLSSEIKGLKVLILGDGELASFVAEETAVNSGWRWIKKMPYRRMPEFFSKLTLLISPTRALSYSAEQVGLANLEAFSCGVPVAAYDSGSLREFFPPGWRYFAKEGDSDKLYTLCLKLLRSPALRKAASRQGVSHIKNRYSLVENVKEIEDWFFPQQGGVIFAKATDSVAGGELHTLALAAGLKKRGYKVAVLTNPDSPLAARTDLPLVKLFLGKEAVTRFKIASFWLGRRRYLKNARIVLQKLYLAGFRSLVCQSINEKIVLTAAAERLNMKVVWLDLQNVNPYLKINPLFPLLEKKAGRVVLATSSQYCSRQHQEVYGFKPKVVYPGVDQSKITPRRADRFNRRKVVLATAGRLHREKGVDFFIKLLSKLDRRYSGVVIGDGEERSALERLARELRLGKRLTFTGKLSFKELASFWEKIDILIQPSRRDNTPLSVIEALARGIPAVGFKVGGVGEVIGAGGELAKPFSVGGLAEAVRRVSGDYQKYSQLALLQAKKFRSQKMAAEFEKLLR